MPEEKETFHILQSCWRELQRLHRSSAELKDACATNQDFLTGGPPSFRDLSPGANGPRLFCQSWRQQAEQTRDLAHRVTVAKAKPQLLAIADAYDRLED